jgi:hypothetical protein
MGRLLLILLAAMALLSASSHVWGSRVASTHEPDRVRSSWGKRLNPTGAIPDSGFKAIYFDRDNPGHVVFEENVESIAIKYALADFHRIKSENFAGYWIGKLNFAEQTTQQISVSQSWAKSRIIINGKIVFDQNSRSETFTHSFSPGEHVVEVEYINNWHTVEYKVTIEDVGNKLTEAELAGHLHAQKARRANLYYVGLYESARKDTSVDVAVPPRRKPVVLWLTSYEAIDWNIGPLGPGSTVIVSSYAPGSRVRGPEASQVVRLDRAWGIHSETKRCTCAAGIYHCEASQDLEDVAQKLRAATNLQLSGYAMAYSASALAIRPYDGDVSRRILEQRTLSAAAEQQCRLQANPDFDTLMN